MELNFLGLSLISTKKLNDLYRRVIDQVHQINGLEDTITAKTLLLTQETRERKALEKEISWRVGAEYCRADGTAPYINEGDIVSYVEQRESSLRRRRLTCSVALLMTKDSWRNLTEVSRQQGWVELRGLKWKVTSFSFSAREPLLDSEVFLELEALVR